MSAGWPFPAKGSEPGGGKLALHCDLQARRRAGRMPPTPARPVPGWQHFTLNILPPLSDGLGKHWGFAGEAGGPGFGSGSGQARRPLSSVSPHWVLVPACGCLSQQDVLSRAWGRSACPLMRQCHLACIRTWPAQNNWSGTCLCCLAI